MKVLDTNTSTSDLYKIVSALFMKPTVPVQQTTKRSQQLYQIPGTNQLISLPGKQLQIILLCYNVSAYCSLLPSLLNWYVKWNWKIIKYYVIVWVLNYRHFLQRS